MMTYTGIASSSMKCGRNCVKGIGLKIEIRELENYFKSWN